MGFVADIRGRASREIMTDARQINARMGHRSGCGFEENTGDGTGILTATPHKFFADVFGDLGMTLPEPQAYAVGNVFLPNDPEERAAAKGLLARIVEEEGQTLIGFRELPIAPDEADIGPAARQAMPFIEQVAVAAEDAKGAKFAEATTKAKASKAAKGVQSAKASKTTIAAKTTEATTKASGKDAEDAAKNSHFDRALYRIRKRFTAEARWHSDFSEAGLIYVCSLNSKVIVYKGMLTPSQLFTFYPDLEDPRFESHLAMVHSRFSTNTFPSWDRAQPNRFMSHNGEINTVMGNKNWMTARQGVVSSDKFGSGITALFPIVEPDCADSGSFDNVLEFLLMTGRSLQEAVMMMIPEAWQGDAKMPAAEREFYEYHSALMEPWDGPASIAFTDGHYIGAVLDRNGLRPSRYYLTHDDKVIMASEVGVLPLPPESIKEKGRLQPGKMFLIDFVQGRLIPDDELKAEFARRRPYGEWLARQKIELEDLLPPKLSAEQALRFEPESLIQRMQAFGYTVETMQFMLIPLVLEGRDPLGSMGNDAALACLSDKPRMIYDYFKQLFAQVTNPAIDSIREEVVMSLGCFIGPEGNLIDTSEGQARRLHLPHPILSNSELHAIREMNLPGTDTTGWRSLTIDITFNASDGKEGMLAALDDICERATQAIADGYAVIILSDRGLSAGRMALPSLIACGAVHHHLIRRHQRTRIGLIMESGEAREVHHHCLLVGYGADAINPYLAFEALWQSQQDGLLPQADYPSVESMVAGYRKGVSKGMLKVMGKMGISTLQSYKGAQIFEAAGLADEIVERCFAGTASRVHGVDFNVLFAEMKARHETGYPPRDGAPGLQLPNPGEFQWRRGGDIHLWDPDAIAGLQLAARTDSREAYRRFAEHANLVSTRQATLRGLLRFKDGGGGIDISEVEPAAEIVKRFCTGAMSFGSISAETHETLAVAMNRLGGRSNSGEGGEDPARFAPLPGGDSKRSAIKQVASGRFGVTIWYLANADELQIKIVQGAKPGEGGELPGYKVDGNIARIRHSTPGVGLISPPPHHDIYSIEDIAQLIHDLKNANPNARISVKLGSEIGVGTIAAGVTKARADHLVISGHDGGTGASPLTSIKHAGMPWELGLAETHQTLVKNNLRSRVVLQTDGQLKTGRDLAVAILLGAEEFGFATAPLVSLGCIMMRKCHLNTCPVGIATQDPELRKKFTGRPEHLMNYFFMVAEELREIMAGLGIRRVNDMIGRVDLLHTGDAIDHWKAKGLNLSRILAPAEVVYEGTEVYCTQGQEHGLEGALDKQLIELAAAGLSGGEKVRIEREVNNTDRVVGTMLSHRVAEVTEGRLLPEDSIWIKLNGTAGQSLGAWLAAGVTLEVEGDANDYVGKGLSGGKIIIYPPAASSFAAEDNVLVGNVVLYGATSGEAYFRGIAAERFCVRNSGAHAVIEGIGDHGCEYMTGGRVAVLGPTGRNFGAGMSGGIAYIWNRDGDFESNCNLDSFELEPLTEQDAEELRAMIENHRRYTASPVADHILKNWQREFPRFIKAMPSDYKRVLEAQTPEEEPIAEAGA